MKSKKLCLVALLLLLAGLTGVYAQETLSAAGGNASGSGGSASYSIGQAFYSTSSGTNGSVAQGVQQPFEISVLSGIDEGTSINLVCTAYPNPTTDFLILKIDASTVPSTESLSYQLYDQIGKLLVSKRIEGNETSIDMKILVPAIYFLKVTGSNKTIKTFKIIKTQ